MTMCELDIKVGNVGMGIRIDVYMNSKVGGEVQILEFDGVQIEGLFF